jgi:polysaccharide pyruvyl transferase WcaK-like protein
VVDDLHLPQKGVVVPDLAFSLESPAVSTKVARTESLVVGINPLPLYTEYWYLTDFEKYRSYVGKLAAFADWLVGRGCAVHFIPTQLKVDPAVISDVREQMATNGRAEYEGLIVEPTIQSLEDLRSSLSELDIMVATRYHAIVLSLALHKPVLAIAYHPKSRDLMNWLNLGDYVTDGDSFAVEELKERIRLLEKKGGSIASALRQQIPDFEAAVHAQYREVFEMLDADH